MKRKKLRSIMGLALVMMMFCFSGQTVYADTTDFTLTVTRTGYNQDIKSKRTVKASGAAYENKFFATAKNFSNTGRMIVKSVRLDNTSFYSYDRTFDSGNKKQVSAGYKGTAKAGVYYYLQGAYSSSSNNYSLTVTGRYTP